MSHPECHAVHLDEAGERVEGRLHIVAPRVRVAGHGRHHLPRLKVGCRVDVTGSVVVGVGASTFWINGRRRGGKQGRRAWVSLAVCSHPKRSMEPGG